MGYSLVISKLASSAMEDRNEYIWCDCFLSSTHAGLIGPLYIEVWKC